MTSTPSRDSRAEPRTAALRSAINTLVALDEDRFDALALVARNDVIDAWRAIETEAAALPADPDENVWKAIDGDQAWSDQLSGDHVPHRGNHNGYACGFSGPHDLIPYPKVGKWAEVRMIYCRRCGATQPVESGDRPPLGPCALAASEAAALDVTRLTAALASTEAERDRLGSHDEDAEIIAAAYLATPDTEVPR